MRRLSSRVDSMNLVWWYSQMVVSAWRGSDRLSNWRRGGGSCRLAAGFV
jgi:hypothetical protein